MLTEYLEARNTNEAYHKWKEENKLTNSEYEINTLVLSNTCWQNINDSDLKLPLQLSLPKNNFYNFYKENNPKKELTWMHNVSVLQIDANFNKVYSLNTSMTQGLILLQFNSLKVIDENELFSNIQCTQEEFICSINELVLIKFMILG